MTIPRAISVTLALVAVAMLATSTLGYTSASVDRGVQVNVVEAEDAYVNVSVCERGQANGQGNGANPVKVVVTNQHVGSFTVESITWSDDAHPQKEGLEPEDVVNPGSSVTYNNAFGTDEVTVAVSGSLDAEVTVDVETCGSDYASGSNSSNNGSDSNASGVTSGSNATDTGADPDTSEDTTASGNETNESSSTTATT